MCVTSSSHLPSLSVHLCLLVSTPNEFRYHLSQLNEHVRPCLPALEASQAGFRDTKYHLDYRDSHCEQCSSHADSKQKVLKHREYSGTLGGWSVIITEGPGVDALCWGGEKRNGEIRRVDKEGKR